MSDAKLSSTRAELLRRGTRCGNELQLISMHAPCAVRATAGSTVNAGDTVAGCVFELPTRELKGDG